MYIDLQKMRATVFVNQTSLFVLLLVSSDSSDRHRVQSALALSNRSLDVRYVESSTSMLSYLNHQGDYSNPKQSPEPDLILFALDASDPDRWQALEQIKAHPVLSAIPIVVMASSILPSDVQHSYEIGVSSYLLKPNRDTEWLQMMETLSEYWFQVVELPRAPEKRKDL
ncbi:hypothetical protein ACQ4M4_24290 [Leptolyngbya sp. AN02str]|uniref:hypothetical protein n=1 Tax=Leptolyngbya sp. AN02str TaxID=3423363 RepID=UPI003D31D2B8